MSITSVLLASETDGREDDPFRDPDFVRMPNHVFVDGDLLRDKYGAEFRLVRMPSTAPKSPVRERFVR